MHSVYMELVVAVFEGSLRKAKMWLFFGVLHVARYNCTTPMFIIVELCTFVY